MDPVHDLLLIAAQRQGTLRMSFVYITGERSRVELEYVFQDPEREGPPILIEDMSLSTAAARTINHIETRELGF